MNKPVVIFDGFCNLCNASVCFIIRNDPKEVFLFSSLNTNYYQKKIKGNHTGKQDGSSILLFEENMIFDKSTAVLRISRKLKGAWPLLYIFIVVPKPIRDFMYDLIAKYRYAFFGRADSCTIPDNRNKFRFLK